MHNLDKNFDNLSLQCANIIKMLNKLSLDYNEKSIKFERTYKKILKRLPKSIMETDLYKKTEKLLNPKDIKLEDLTWLESECWNDKTIIELKNLILISLTFFSSNVRYNNASKCDNNTIVFSLFGISISLTT